MSKDYSQFASMMGNKDQMSFLTFNTIRVSGDVKREELPDGTEKRLPAEIIFTDLKNKGAAQFAPTTLLGESVSLIPLKLRSMLEARSGDGKEVIMYSTEYNNGGDDIVTITDKTDGDKKYTMTVKEARKKFVTSDGKSLLRQSHRLYALYKGEEGYEVVRFVIKGAGVWEGPEAATKEMSISEYLSTFAKNEPAFLYWMKVTALYRPKQTGKVAYYRPIFTRGTRIDPATEEIVLKELTAIHEYCTELDKLTPSSKMTDAEVSAVNTAKEDEVITAPSADPEMEDLGF